MGNKATSAKHIAFITLVAKGSTLHKAYIETCGDKKTTNSNARSRGSKLAKRYALEIAEWKQKLTKILERANETSEAKTALKSVLNDIANLRDKAARLMELQMEYDDLRAKQKGDVEFTFVIGNKINKSHSNSNFVLPIQIQLDIERAIDSKRKQISELEGEYAPVKTQTEITGELKLPPPSPERIKEISKKLKDGC